MNRVLAVKFGALVCAIALLCGVLAGCANTAANTATEAQQANRAYMSQVNEIMESLGKELDSFVDAVSRGDIVNMRTQADNAYRVLDKLDNLEAPDELADVQEKYQSGTKKLREALDDYITLYTEASGDSFDWSTYDDRIKEIQDLYDEGLKDLEDGDKAAAGKS